MKRRAVAFLVLLSIFSVLMMGSSSNSAESPASLSDVPVSGLESSQVYLADQLYIVESYATKTQNFETIVIYLLTLHQDSNGEWVLSSMLINRDMDIWEPVNKYLNDSSQGVFDLKLNCYVKTSPPPSGEVLDYYDKSVDLWSNYYNDLHNVSPYSLSYICDHTKDPYETMKSENVFNMIMFGGSLFLMAGLLWFLYIKPRKEARKQAAWRTAQLEAQHRAEREAREKAAREQAAREEQERRMAQERAVREAQEQAAREKAAREEMERRLAQERAAREVHQERVAIAPQQPVASPQPATKMPSYEQWWTGISTTIPVSQMANNADTMLSVYDSCPNTVEYRKRLLEFFQMLAPATLAQLYWTCADCGTHNPLGTDCHSCGRPYYGWTCPVCGKRNRVDADCCSCGYR